MYCIQNKTCATSLQQIIQNHYSNNVFVLRRKQETRLSSAIYCWFVKKKAVDGVIGIGNRDGDVPGTQ